MHTFFHGWRRKAGVVTLVMACAMMALWVHSIAGYVAAKVVVNDQSYVLMTYHGRFECVTFDRGFHPVDWCFLEAKSSVFAGTRFDRQFQNLHYQIAGSVGRVIVRVNYEWMVPLLTLRSAYLILWKPWTRG